MNRDSRGGISQLASLLLIVSFVLSPFSAFAQTSTPALASTSPEAVSTSTDTITPADSAALTPTSTTAAAASSNTPALDPATTTEPETRTAIGESLASPLALMLDAATTTSDGASSTPGITTTASTSPARVLAPDAPGLALKAPAERHLGFQEFPNGTVKYAYKTDTDIDSVPAGTDVAAAAEKRGLRVGSEVIGERTSHSRTFATDRAGVYVTEIIPGDPQYYRDSAGRWWQVDYGTTTKASYDLQTKPKPKGLLQKIISFFLPKSLFADTTSTFYPDPNPESSSVDGYVNKFDTNGVASWSTIHDATVGTESHDDVTYAYVQSVVRSGGLRAINRGVFLFDTSSIPDTNQILSATLSLYIPGKGNVEPDGYDYFNVFQSSPASNTALSTDDYDQVGAVSSPTKGSTDIDVDNITTGAYTNFALNSAGLSWINVAGVTKLGLREGHDIDSVAPTHGGDGVYIEVRTADYTGTSNDPKLVVVHQAMATAPTSLQVDGQTNPVNQSNTHPGFSAIYNDPDAGDVAGSYQIQVSASTSFATPYWDSGKSTLASSTPNGSRIQNVIYNGPTLNFSTTYYWRIKFWDSHDYAGVWSTTTSTFSLAFAQATTTIQDTSFAYDNVGNITQVTDNSGTAAAKVVNYSYDSLNRLTSASTTMASSTPYSQTYAYNAIGDLTNKSDQGSYSYAGTGYANPHAATSVGSTTLSYDNNGNLTSDGTWTQAWDYLNRLTQSSNGGSTTTYAYDFSGSRVRQTTGATTTRYAVLPQSKILPRDRCRSM